MPHLRVHTRLVDHSAVHGLDPLHNDNPAFVLNREAACRSIVALSTISAISSGVHALTFGCTRGVELGLNHTGELDWIEYCVSVEPLGAGRGSALILVGAASVELLVGALGDSPDRLPPAVVYHYLCVAYVGVIDWVVVLFSIVDTHLWDIYD
jgi:hypothetical protein